MAALHDAMIPIEDLAEVFSDVTPLPQNDGPDRVCVIQYPTAFALAYNYMRAIWQSGEKSGTSYWSVDVGCVFLPMNPLIKFFITHTERTLKLSATCAKLNPANYTVWHYRRECLRAMGLATHRDVVQTDLALAAALGGPNPKNYQVCVSVFLTVIPSIYPHGSQNISFPRSVFADLVPPSGVIGDPWSPGVLQVGAGVHSGCLERGRQKLSCLVVPAMDFGDGGR
jgi:Protein prenyltransferase alpha subunit repeat